MTKLIDFIQEQDEDIAQQYQYLNQIDKLLDRLPRTLNPTKSPEKKKPNKISTRKEKPSKKEQEQNQNQEKSLDELFKDKMKQLIDSEREQLSKQRKSNLNIDGSNSPCVDQDKMEQYRNDLLKQIKEKEELKRKKEEKQRTEEQMLEMKIAQQRLSMYLEYLHERERHQSLKIIEPDENETTTRSSSAKSNRRKSLTRINSNDQEVDDQTINTETTATNQKIPRKHSSSPAKKLKSRKIKSSKKMDLVNNKKPETTRYIHDQQDGNIDVNIETETEPSCSTSRFVQDISFQESFNNVHQRDDKIIHLADLNEVRKIMQNDHYELLEKLFQLNI